ncbi:MAG TPA: hypothetical protein VFN81_08695 [Sphingomicrobium sp.]|nr:hypothetical protein [Sphingomicrobium sp.]
MREKNARESHEDYVQSIAMDDAMALASAQFMREQILAYEKALEWAVTRLAEAGVPMDEIAVNVKEASRYMQSGKKG